MKQLLSQTNQILQTALAAISVLMAMNLGQALAAAPNTDKTHQVVMVAVTSKTMPSTPVLLLADPGMAYVMSTPLRQLQLRVESAGGLCHDQLLQTDDTGLLMLPMANTKRCKSPRLVVLH